jgi:hypothetical protein
MKIITITRASQFSPNSVDSDHAIMQAVADRLTRQGHEVTIVSETDLINSSFSSPSSTIFSMGRLPQTLAWLRRQTCRVINTPESVAACTRSSLERIMLRHHLPSPPRRGDKGYWLKRDDGPAQTADDILFCKDKCAVADAIRQFNQRGITDYTLSAHVEGDLVKFYGVRGTGFFRYYYPTDDGQTKFGLERFNGKALHYHFSLNSLQQDAEWLAALVGLDVYGGDCIVRADGTYCFIDFNDWPSFCRCRDEAADAIAKLIAL